MKLTINLIIGLVLSASAFAGALTEKDVQQLFEDVHYADTTLRVEYISGKFLGTAYKLDGFGEGEKGDYDQDPLYRFDAFDCTTLVETITALALSSNFEDFKNTLDRIRYKDGLVSYVTRNHFPSLDWIPNNVDAGFYEDITAAVAQEAILDVATAEAVVDKRKWYASKTLEDLKVAETNKKKLKERLAQWRKEGRAFKKTLATLPYLKLADIFSEGADRVLKFIPSGAIINIVRPGWNIRDKKTGKLITQLNISHQGFAIWKNSILYFREASLSAQIVRESPLKEYLAQLLDSETIKGINILQIK